MRAFDFIEKSSLAIECDSFHLYGKPTRDMTETEIVKIILVQQHVYDSIRIFSLLYYFPLPRQNNKNSLKSLKKVLVVEFNEIFKKV